MEVKPGYKQTEIGVIPENWIVMPLREFAHFRNGLNFVKSDQGDMVKVVGVADFQSNFRVSYDQLDTVQISGSLGNDDLLKSGDLLFVRSNGNKALIGRCVLIDSLTEPVSFSGFTIRARISRTTAVPEYVGRFFQSNRAKRQIKEAGEGSHISNLSQQILGSLKIPLPTLAEQEAIAGVLSDADALIESLEQLVAKKRQIKHGAMQELLTGQKRLSGFTINSGYKQTEVGVIPEDWVARLVRSMGEVRAGKALAAWGPGKQRPYLRTKNVFDGRIDIDDVHEMPMTDSEFMLYRLRYGDVLLNEGQSIGLVGRCAMYKNEFPWPCAIQNQLVRFRANGETSETFATHVFRRCQQSGVFSKIAMQTTSVAHLGVSRFANLKLAWPPTRAEQEAIAAVLSDIDAENAAIENRLSKARQVQQGMMQELLTGKTRLVKTG